MKFYSKLIDAENQNDVLSEEVFFKYSDEFAERFSKLRAKIEKISDYNLGIEEVKFLKYSGILDPWKKDIKYKVVLYEYQAQEAEKFLTQTFKDLAGPIYNCKLSLRRGKKKGSVQLGRSDAYATTYTPELTVTAIYTPKVKVPKRGL